MNINRGTLNSELRTLNSNRIARILDSGFKAVLVTTGGGSGALHSLLSTPGASRFIADAQIPYSPEALERFLGEKSEQSVSPATARALAEKAFFQCLENVKSALRADLRSESAHCNKSKCVGVACTAALQTNRERRGDDRAFICIKTEKAEKLYALYFSKTSRKEQEAFLSEWLLVLIAQAVGAERGLMLPGSFHPVHQGHINLLQAAEDLTGLHGLFELSCANVDKPDIPEDEILRRASAIKDIPVALTHAPRFVQKAELFPNTTFVLGHDTAVRLVENNHTFEGVIISKPWTRAQRERPRECGAVTEGRGNNQWEFFQALETKFLVAGRVFQCLEKNEGGGSASFQCLEDLNLPKGFESLFEAVPKEKFREDISSKQLRMS